MHKIKYLFNNENGSVIVVTIMILALLTILGHSAINTSTTEQQLATNTLLYERAFYAAEAGFEHAKAVLKVPFIEQNQANIALANQASWSFVLNESGVIPGLAAATDSDGDGVGDFEGGVILVQTKLEGVSYTVTVWNNDDRAKISPDCNPGGPATAGTPICDTDGRIMVRTLATGPRGATCAIESLIEGGSDSGGMFGIPGQAGAGSGKSYRNNDLYSITDFSQQM
jgi:hypothetical protein